MEESLGTANGPICRANLAEEEVEVASVRKEKTGRISKSMMAKGSNSRVVLSNAFKRYWPMCQISLKIIYTDTILYTYFIIFLHIIIILAIFI